MFKNIIPRQTLDITNLRGFSAFSQHCSMAHFVSLTLNAVGVVDLSVTVRTVAGVAVDILRGVGVEAIGLVSLNRYRIHSDMT